MHGTNYSIIPDQIEAGTYMAAVAATGGRLLIRNVIPKHMDCISAKLTEMGVTVEECVEMSKRLGQRIWDELKIPSFLYEDSATCLDSSTHSCTVMPMVGTKGITSVAPIRGWAP